MCARRHAAADPQGRCPHAVRHIDAPQYTRGDAHRANTGRWDTVIEPSASLRKFLRALQGRRLDEVPWAPLSKPLAESRVALVTSSVCLVHGDPHEYVGVEIGDPSFREIDSEVDAGELLARSRGRAGDGAAKTVRPQAPRATRTPSHLVDQPGRGEGSRRTVKPARRCLIHVDRFRGCALIGGGGKQHGSLCGSLWHIKNANPSCYVS